MDPPHDSPPEGETLLSTARETQIQYWNEQAGRTWVFLTEAAEGGWGVSGFALGKEDFTALRGG